MRFSDLGLALELHAWRLAGRTARLWWRDDDARTATPALDRMLELSDRYGVPLALAVIPGDGAPALAEALRHRPQVTVIQHGVDHLNRRDGPAAGEFPPHWSAAELAVRLEDGWASLCDLPHAEKIFAPPWNDVHPLLAAALAATGYAGWSAWCDLEPSGAPPRVDAHIDLLRWRGGARFRGAGRLASALQVALRTRRRRGLWDAPIGLLTHHLDHDEPAWAFLERLLAWSTQEQALAWTGLNEFLPTAATPAHSAAG